MRCGRQLWTVTPFCPAWASLDCDTYMKDSQSGVGLAHSNLFIHSVSNTYVKAPGCASSSQTVYLLPASSRRAAQ